MAIGRVLQQEIQEAVEALRAGELVAFPTETVYGLGANANNPDAVRKIFRAKGRPSTHPVIVHIDHPRYLQRWVREMTPEAKKLADAFWPGPLTLVAKRAPAVNDVITGGQDTVAIRVPNHPVAQQLLNAFGGGIAAPSANRFGHVSPTRAEHVREEFGDEVKFVLDGGDCKVGLESTIISCLADGPRVLRPGSISFSQLKAVVPTIQMGPNPSAPRVPGSTSRHYSPTTPVNVVPSRRLETVMNEFTANHEKVAVLAQRPPGTANPFMTWINAGIRPDIYARNLYANLRTLDKAGAKIILVEEVPEGEKWDAVRDRLRRAATAENIVTYDQDIAAWVADFGEEGGPPG
ncbi:MAG TPA: L-threonylcarbamoyladenylate synthase [Steroidobacter sp.]|uniref:L-threonylcarbamoyladenylate synthase n=1 Tax=Steroidobacter sp. TaxID=1978227 RepID=UPI002ED9F6AA